MRPPVIGRSVRCLKARTRSTWRSNSCTGSSPWSWMSNGDTFLSSPTRSRRRQRAPRQDRYIFNAQTNKAAFSTLKAVQLSGSWLVFVSQVDSASQQQLGSVLATQQEVLNNLNELRWVAVDVWTSCCFCHKNMKVDPWYSLKKKKPSEIRVVKPFKFYFNLSSCSVAGVCPADNPKL